LGGGTALTAGNEYWFAASAIGASGSGSYQVGGHTQGTAGPDDNGSFWYSNASDGSTFGGQNLQPEMAFTVTIGGSSSVPDAGSSMLLLGLSFGGITALRRRVSKV
jgi:hypothetical protein